MSQIRSQDEFLAWTEVFNAYYLKMVANSQKPAYIVKNSIPVLKQVVRLSYPSRFSEDFESTRPCGFTLEGM